MMYLPTQDLRYNQMLVSIQNLVAIKTSIIKQQNSHTFHNQYEQLPNPQTPSYYFIRFLMDQFNLWSDQITSTYISFAITFMSKIITLLTIIVPKKTAVGGIYEESEQLPVMVETKDPSKAIVCVDFKNLLLEYSDRRKEGFTKLDIDKKKTFWQRLMFWQDTGYYYKKRFRADHFLRGLKRTPNTILYLYTIEDKNTADKLIEELSFTEFFPKENRFYRNSCKIVEGVPKKHPAYLDTMAARVIIITSDIDADCDDSNQSSRYFFEIQFSQDDRTLLTYGKMISETILSNKERENLLEELENRFINV